MAEGTFFFGIGGKNEEKTAIRKVTFPVLLRSLHMSCTIQYHMILLLEFLTDLNPKIIFFGGSNTAFSATQSLVNL